jgi:hypothetical protein
MLLWPTPPIQYAKQSADHVRARPLYLMRRPASAHKLHPFHNIDTGDSDDITALRGPGPCALYTGPPLDRNSMCCMTMTMMVPMTSVMTMMQ